MKIKFILLLITAFTYRSAAQEATPINDKRYGNNIISLSPYLINNFGLGTGLGYERILSDDGRLSFVTELMYNGHEKNAYSDRYRERVFGFGLGFKFYPASSRGPVKYAIGASITNFFVSRKYEYTGSPGGRYYTDDVKAHNQAGVMIDNSVSFTIFRKLCIGLNLGLGISMSTEENYDASVPFILLHTSFGYRF